MGDEGEAALLKKVKVTQEVLGGFIRRPPLTEKHLMKPPFRFIHDIVMSVIESTGFLNGLYEGQECDASTITTRETKTAFMQKFIDCLRIATGEEVDVKVSKILAGQEAGKTNDLLICLGNALAKGINSDKAVESVTGKAVLGKGAADPKEKKKAANAAAAAKLKETSPYGTAIVKKTGKPGAPKAREDAARSKDGGKGQKATGRGTGASNAPSKGGKAPVGGGGRQVSVDRGGNQPARASGSKSDQKVTRGGKSSVSSSNAPAEAPKLEVRRMSGTGILDEAEPGSLGSGDTEEAKVSNSRRGSLTNSMQDSSRSVSKYGRDGRGTPRRGSMGGEPVAEVLDEPEAGDHNPAEDAEKAEFMGELEFLLKKHGLAVDEQVDEEDGIKDDQEEDEEEEMMRNAGNIQEKVEVVDEEEGGSSDKDGGDDKQEPDTEDQDFPGSGDADLVNNSPPQSNRDNPLSEDVNNNDPLSPAVRAAHPAPANRVTTPASRESNDHDRVVGSSKESLQARKSSSSSRSSMQSKEPATSGKIGFGGAQTEETDQVVDDLLVSRRDGFRDDNGATSFSSTTSLSVTAALGSVSPPFATKSSSSSILPDINEKAAQRPPSARPHTSQMRGGVPPGPIPRPPSARPAPPRPKTALLVDKEEPSFRPTTAKVANVLLDNDDEDDDSNFIVHEITPASKTTDLADQVDLGLGKSSSSMSEDNIDMILDPDQRGLLVNQILDSQSKLEDGSKLMPGQKKTDIERDSLLGEKDRMRLREITAGEVDKLKNLMQLMARNANPLGKLMDFVQEDVDAMQRDLNKWREESRKLDAALEAAQEETEKSLEPLRRKMAELDEAIQDRHDSIAATKMSIYRQEERIRKVLLGLDKVKPRSGSNEPKITSADLKNILDDDYGEGADGDKAYFRPTINNFSFNSNSRTMSPV